MWNKQNLSAAVTLLFYFYRMVFVLQNFFPGKITNGCKKTFKDTQKRKKMLSVGSVCDDFTAQEGGCSHTRHACRSHEHHGLKRCIIFFKLGAEDSQTNNSAVWFQLLWLPGVSVNFAFC